VSASPDNVQEDRGFDEDRKKPAAEDTIPESMSVRNSALLAGMVTVAIALFSAGMVFSISDRDDLSQLLLDLPQSIESFFWRNQKTEAKALRKGKEAGPLLEAAPGEHEKDLTEPGSGTLAGPYQEEETRPAGEGLVREASQEAKGEEEKVPASGHRTLESVPTLVVTVQKGDTVSRILKRQFGRSGKILMGGVRELNPEVEDLDVIRVGQKIRLPLSLEVAYEIQTIQNGSDLSIEEKSADFR
jgi:LysM repeat protein